MDVSFLIECFIVYVYDNTIDEYLQVNQVSNDKKTNLVWIDLEMTGLEDNHVIIEVASLVTDSDLNEIATGPVIAIKRSTQEIEDFNEWSLEQHTKSGLLKRVRESSTPIDQADSLTVEFLKNWVEEEKSPICGNSIGTDRRFIRREMPLLDKFLHYRMIDVSTIKELASRWYKTLKIPNKESEHLALADIKESISELKWYRENIFTENNVASPEE